MIEIRNLTVQFGGVFLLRNLEATFTAPICGLIGPNGAGKTTLLNVISGFVTPKSGQVCIEGKDILSLPPAARFRAGLRRGFQTGQVVDDLTVYDNLLAACDQLGLDGTAAAAEITRALNLFERRMAETAKSLVGHPKVILLDEPGAGMSEQESAILRTRLLAIPDRFGCQILLIDHDVDLISATCTETLVLDFGEKLAFGPTAPVLADDKVRNAYLGGE